MKKTCCEFHIQTLVPCHRRRSGNGVTPHTERKVTHTAQVDAQTERGAAFWAGSPTFHHAQIQQEAQEEGAEINKNSPSIHATEPGRKTNGNKETETCYESSEQDAAEKKQRDEQKCGLGLKLWEKGGKLTVFQLQLNCSYLHHNVKGVLVEQEHKKQTETLFSIS